MAMSEETGRRDLGVCGTRETLAAGTCVRWATSEEGDGTSATEDAQAPPSNGGMATTAPHTVTSSLLQDTEDSPLLSGSKTHE